MPSLSVVIPTYNMAESLESLTRSLSDSGLLDVAEIVLVDDGSTDATPTTLEAWRNSVQSKHGVKIVRFPTNRGRFIARREGARAAQSDKLLFIDTRVALKPDFGRAVADASRQLPAYCGWVDVDINRNAFCLYWDRSHRRIFWRNYQNEFTRFRITLANFDDFVKGTTVFGVDKALFLSACDAVPEDLLSDDTLLLKHIAKDVDITIEPTVRINWVPRETWLEFLWRIWDRGPGFAEYHVFERQGLFFWVTAFGVVTAASVLALLVVVPPIGLPVTLAVLGGAALSTAAFAKSPKEFVKLAPLHTAVLSTFLAAAVRGTCVIAGRKLRSMARQ